MNIRISPKIFMFLFYITCLACTSTKISVNKTDAISLAERLNKTGLKLTEIADKNKLMAGFPKSQAEWEAKVKELNALMGIQSSATAYLDEGPVINFYLFDNFTKRDEWLAPQIKPTLPSEDLTAFPIIKCQNLLVIIHKVGKNGHSDPMIYRSRVESALNNSFDCGW